jgi:hypothetical protein
MRAAELAEGRLTTKASQESEVEDMAAAYCAVMITAMV